MSQDRFPIILAAYGCAFAAYISFLRYTTRNTILWIPLIVLAFITRLLMLPSFPKLSDDIYRFIWDGEMSNLGIHPLKYTPEYVISNLLTGNEYLNFLFESMNSKLYYTIYPPVHQFCFYLSTLGDHSSVITSAFILRVIIVLSELGIFYFLLKILNQLNKPGYLVLIYFLNPLILIELSGNLHLESVMIFFFLAFLYFIMTNRILIGSLFFALSIATKLFPLIFLPAILWFLHKNGKAQKFAFSLLMFSLLFFLPMFWSYDLINFLSSLDLYFQKFEFNASIYYLIREVGIIFTGYNQIAVIGPFLALSTFIIVIWLTVNSKLSSIIELVDLIILSFGIYLMLGTTIHPWYLSLLIALCVIRLNYWIILWSFLIVLSYSVYGFAEVPFSIISLEYILLGLFVWIEKKYLPQLV